MSNYLVCPRTGLKVDHPIILHIDENYRVSTLKSLNTDEYYQRNMSLLTQHESDNNLI